MYREKNNRKYYSFPGGGLEKFESEEECTIREVKEEFGINVLPLKKVYIYEDEKSIQHFYLCKWMSGEFGTGDGEEFSANETNGVYLPTQIDVNKISVLPLMPPIVATQLLEDINNCGYNLDDNLKNLTGSVL